MKKHSNYLSKPTWDDIKYMQLYEEKSKRLSKEVNERKDQLIRLLKIEKKVAGQISEIKKEASDNVKNYRESLGKVTQRMLHSLELLEENEIKNVAVFIALAFSKNLSGLVPVPEIVFEPLLNDNLVAKRIPLFFVSNFFQVCMVENSLSDLVEIIKLGNMENKLLEFFPSAKRTPEGFSQHFIEVVHSDLVEYNENRLFELRAKRMKLDLITNKADIPNVVYGINKYVEYAKLQEKEVVRLFGISWWICSMVTTSTKR